MTYRQKKGISEGWGMLSALERRAFCQAMRHLDREHILGVLYARGRAEGKRVSDRRTDGRRRVLVGARVRRELAERVKAAAEKRGISVYRFVVDILEAACENGGG